MAKYLIGDVHGCAQEMYALLAHVDFNPSKDELYFIGDLGCRGPQTLEVLKYAEKYATGVVLGNNDLRVICLVHEGLKPLASDHLEDLLALPRAKQHFYTDWLIRQPLVISEPGFHLVHAALDPLWSSEQIQAYNQMASDYLQGLTHYQRGYYLGYKYFAHTLADLNQAALQGQALTGTWQRDLELRAFSEFMLTTTVARHRQLRQPQEQGILAQPNLMQLEQAYAQQGVGLQSLVINDLSQSYSDFNLELVKEPCLDLAAGIFPWYHYQALGQENHNLTLQGFDRPVFFGHWQQAYYAGTPEGIIATDTGCVEGKSLSIFALPEQLLAEQNWQQLAQPLHQIPKFQNF
ncbi:metallophosphoesterase [Psittacicella gerlachiana]|uniref:Calcineurin-like phosphoesterase domain-containing protein n=1 Tax=Psittacicella gerlachiana TaxID=2028574 RepID=A0A3A1YL23_9GAMM|nr:metallophosphoesterase [Psittacicella gerlachiana]RIY37929.1 hypothetical protein CKF59_01195 [Psittacicella gerlachiana]